MHDCRGINVLLTNTRDSMHHQGGRPWSIIFIRKELTMKFTDGYWQMRPGFIPHYAAQVHEVTVEKDTLRVYAPIGKVEERGHTINQPLLTIHYSSPLENVI